MRPNEDEAEMNETQQGTSRLTEWSPYIGALGIALVVAAIFLRIFLNTPTPVLLALGAVGVVLFSIFVFSRPRADLREAVTGRTAVYGSNTLILVAAFVGIVVILNFLADRQFHNRVDLTAGKQHTLSEQTINVLKDLKEPVRVTGFFTLQNQSSRNDAENEIKEYQFHTDQLTVKFIDPDENPTAAKPYELAQDQGGTVGTMVFERGDRREKIYSFDENAFTNAILKVTQSQQPAVYFTTGHGEYSPTNFNQDGFSTIADYLKQVNYKVDVLNLTTVTTTATISGSLPADTSALIVAGPQKAFSSEEEQRIKTFLDHGGRVLVLLDVQTDPGFKDLMAAYSVTPQNDLVLDPAFNYLGNAVIPAFGSFPSHDVTKNLDKYGVFLPAARSLKSGEAGDKTVIALFTTTNEACDKTDLAALQGQTQLQCDPAKDGKGPFVLGYAVEGAAPTDNPNAKQARLVVIGNASFASNRWLSNPNGVGNELLFSNIVNWLAGQEQLIAIPARQSDTRPLTALTGSDVNLIAWSSAGLLPLASLIIGALIWWRRR